MDRKVEDTVLERRGGIFKSLPDVLLFQLRIFAAELVSVRISRQSIEHAPDRDPQMPDARLSVHPMGVDRDPFQVRHESPPPRRFEMQPDAGPQAPLRPNTRLT